MAAVFSPGVLADLLARFGSGTLFVLAVLETSFLTGLVVPSGTAAALAVAVSIQTGGAIWPIALATGAGGFVGDVIGYMIGRRAGERMRSGEGWAARTLRRYEASPGALLGGHPVYAVTVARVVSFVRTIMPLHAGVSGIPLARYLALEIPGLLAWVALYLSIGLVAGESWALASSLVGTGWLVVFIVFGAVVAWRARRGRRDSVPVRGGS
ncbi:MAG: DedA family protein [Longimicrobiales bacterium]|nr:DedA family protein [Longimicrobiales bacterium]